MSSEEIVRAWKDPDYRIDDGFDHPAGDIALEQADSVRGMGTEYILTMGCCGGLTACVTCVVCTDYNYCGFTICFCFP